MRPKPASTMWLWQARDIRNAPRRCTFMTVSQSASLILNSRLSLSTPALFTSTVGAPEFVGDPRHGGGDLVGVGDVAAHGDGLAALRR